MQTLQIGQSIQTIQTVQSGQTVKNWTRGALNYHIVCLKTPRIFLEITEIEITKPTQVLFKIV